VQRQSSRTVQLQCAVLSQSKITDVIPASLFRIYEPDMLGSRIVYREILARVLNWIEKSYAYRNLWFRHRPSKTLRNF